MDVLDAQYQIAKHVQVPLLAHRVMTGSTWQRMVNAKVAGIIVVLVMLKNVRYAAVEIIIFHMMALNIA